MYALEQETPVPVKMWADGVPVEEAAKRQLVALAHLPFIFRHVAVMPDVHQGIGSTIGSVIPTQGAVIPAAVGVDIGCGMSALRTGLAVSDLPERLSDLRGAIERVVPYGRSSANRNHDKGAWQDVPEAVQNIWDRSLRAGFDELIGKYPEFQEANSLHHLGTLGTGNHFIEVCLDEEGRVWIMLHSGSRGIGNAIGSAFIRRAKAEFGDRLAELPDPSLAWFEEGSVVFDDYMEAVGWAQSFAFHNRALMMQAVIGAVEGVLGRAIDAAADVIDCHHNYVERESHFGETVWVTRKGAVCAQAGNLGIIPGSMGAKSYIVRGLGNAESFSSCSHGAGRAMSRTEARKRFTLDDQIKATAHVECRKDTAVIDEIPMAYKDIDAVMEAQKDLVATVHTLRQIVCVKG